MKKERIIWSTIVVILASLFIHQCKTTRDKEARSRVAQDSIISYVTKSGQLVIEKNAIVVENKRQLLRLEDSLKGLLRGIKPNVVAHIKSTTKTSLALPTIIERVDTQYFGGDTVYVWPSYQAHYIDKWRDVSVEAGKDSVYINTLVYNDLYVMVGQNAKWFTSETKIRAVDKNPYTKSSSLNAYYVRPQLPRVSFGLQTGAGVDLLTSKPILYIGGGATYNINRKQLKLIEISRKIRRVK